VQGYLTGRPRPIQDYADLLGGSPGRPIGRVAGAY
jgi:hypothetical protein